MNLRQLRNSRPKNTCLTRKQHPEHLLNSFSLGTIRSTSIEKTFLPNSSLLCPMKPQVPHTWVQTPLPGTDWCLSFNLLLLRLPYSFFYFHIALINPDLTQSKGVMVQRGRERECQGSNPRGLIISGWDATWQAWVLICGYPWTVVLFISKGLFFCGRQLFTLEPAEFGNSSLRAVTAGNCLPGIQCKVWSGSHSTQELRSVNKKRRLRTAHRIAPMPRGEEEKQVPRSLR